MEKIACNHLNRISESAKLIIDLCKDTKVWVFQGEMGVGKTTLIKAISEQLQVLDLVTSPTFSLVNEYELRQGGKIFHFDFYRIANVMEAVEIGAEDYFYSGNYCFVEWAEKIAELIPDHFAIIDIQKEDFEKRIISVKIIKK
ncbi:MAG: tRNA (adenosine(37)-N6)-threonylcarbamoyltransferase complex ATPase subunit type 1 TsaE [Cyclobacteriaceae bacterium]